MNFFLMEIPIPNDIKFRDISCISLNISWKIDDLNNINIS